MSEVAINNLTISIGDNVLLKNFSHRFFGGQITALVGDNGAGKTTLLKIIAGLGEIKNGAQIFLDKEDLSVMQPRRRAQLISLLMQHTPIQPFCTARSRIAHGLMPTQGFQHFLDKESNRLIENTAEKLTIKRLLDRRLAHMSGGEQRLVHIAKCLINPNTQILLLDEPTAFLDFTQQANLLRNLHEQRSLGRVVIFSSHDAAFIKQVADQVVMIKDKEFSFLTTPTLLNCAL